MSYFLVVYHIFVMLEKKNTSHIIPVHLKIVKKKKKKNAALPHQILEKLAREPDN
jgi:hypothetical protein